MRTHTRRYRAPAFGAFAVAALILAGCTGGGGGGGGTPSGPVSAGLRGPFPVGQRLAGPHAGFGGATIHYPTTPGTYGGIVVVPGFISVRQQVGWLGPVYASHGFVTLVMDTITVVDLPSARAAEQLAAVNFLGNQDLGLGQVHVDPQRMGVTGWSMGGGGTLQSSRNARVKASIPMAPWDINAFPLNDTPTMIVACNGDLVAPPALMARPFYSQLNGPKAYLGLPNVTNHFCVTNPNATLARYGVAWMKRFIDDDVRYEQIICDRPGVGVQYQTSRVCGI